MPSPDLTQLTQKIEAAGFVYLGAFHNDPKHTLILIGNAGPQMWQRFQAAKTTSLDNWTRDTVGDLADALDAQALFPFDEPPHPFLTWAQKTGATFTSPIGMSIHPDYGLWHGYRAALIIEELLDLPVLEPQISPCDSCTDKPCLTTCPVNAFTPHAYDVPACIAHIKTTDTPDCLEQGCRARRACPVGQNFHYSPQQAEFHMSAFVRANG